MELTADTNVKNEIRRILRTAGLREGEFQSRGVRGQYFDAATWGYKIGVIKPTGLPGVLWLYVDHVGKGQPVAVRDYAAILRASGLDTSVQPIYTRQKKTYAVVEVPVFDDYKPAMELIRSGLRFEP